MPPRVQRILIVSGDVDERSRLSLIFKSVLAEGSAVTICSSGKEAIAYLMGDGRFSDRNSFPFPTCVLTDLHMPDGDGFDLLEFMLSTPACVVLPRLVLTSSNDEEDVRTALLLGASAYHVKPSRIGELQDLVHRLVDYWATSLLARFDEAGRLCESEGRSGGRFPQAPPREQ
jgi:two-component system, response regulator